MFECISLIYLKLVALLSSHVPWGSKLVWLLQMFLTGLRRELGSDSAFDHAS